MNDYIFFTLIYPWIPFKDLPVTVNKRTREFVGRKRRSCSQPFFNIQLDICVHSGDPCYRYCICKFFSYKDKLYAFNRL